MTTTPSPNSSHSAWSQFCAHLSLIFHRILNFIRKHGWMLLSLFLLLLIGCGFVLFFTVRSCTKSIGNISIESSNKIELTPQEIRSIKEIGEWEFLAVHTEEMVDTLARGFFSDRRLARIYQGTLHMGIDMSEVKENWITSSGDTLFLQLPPIRVLDKDFIHEAQTRSFYEKGQWDPEARAQLLQKARRQIIARCFTAENLKIAKKNGYDQLSSLFKTFGFNVIIIDFEK